MNGEKISILLQKKGLNFSILAAATGVTTAHAYNVAFRKTTSFPVAEKISRAIDQPFSIVFPDYAEKQRKTKERAEKISRLSQKLSQL